jgi:hypothetical protein
MNNSHYLRYFPLLLGLLPGCITPTQEPEQNTSIDGDFELFHAETTTDPGHDADTHHGRSLLRATQVRTSEFAFRIQMRADLDTYLTSAEDDESDPDFRPTIDDLPVRGIELIVTITDSFGRVRHIDPICNPLRDLSLSPVFEANSVLLTRLVEWDRTSDTGVLMQGNVRVQVDINLLDQHDHRFHEEIPRIVLSSSSRLFRITLPSLDGEDNDDDCDNGNDHHGSHHGSHHSNHH